MCLEVGDMTIYFTITVSHIGYFCCFVIFGAFKYQITIQNWATILFQVL